MTMHAIRPDENDDPRASDRLGAAERLVAVRRRSIADFVAPLRAEADLVREEIETLREAARRKVWETIVQTREIHARICDAQGRLEHLQLDIREQTGEVRLPAVPSPFVDFLLGEIRRFVATPAERPAE
jgi:hypothetical protein